MSDLNLTERKPATALEVALMDQVPVSGQRGESPLHHAGLAELASQGSTQGGVMLQELKLLGHLVLRGSTNNAEFAGAVRKVLGVELPGPLESVDAGDASLRWISPDEWLLILPGEEAFTMESRLRELMRGHFAIVNVSGGQTLLTLSGSDAVSVLKKSTGYDVHDRNFPVGKVVTTTFAKTQVVIRRTGKESWELVVRRSFADYLWLWLQDAAAEFGLAVRS